MVTLETLTDKQIRALRREALAAQDYHTVDVCDRALTPDVFARENPIALACWTQAYCRGEIVWALNENPVDPEELGGES